MPSTLSPNMSLILPTVGQEPGPNWALDLNSSLSLIDQHNHASGSGVQITPAGINVNVDLPFSGNNATGLKSARFDVQGSPLSGGLDIGCIYVSGQDLYYNDTLGNQVQLTASGAVNGTPGSIGNLIAPAAVTYVPGNLTFVFESNQSNATPAAIDCGPVLIRNLTAASNYIQLQANPVLPGNYSITLPSSLPASQQFMTINSLGNVISVAADNSTVEIAANTLQVKDLGITTSKLADQAVTTAKIADLNVTTIKIADANVTNAKMAANSVDTAQLVDASVTLAKQGPANFVSANLSNFGGYGPSDIGNVSITTNGSNSLIIVSVNGRALPYNAQIDGVSGSYVAVTLTGPGGYSQALYLNNFYFAGSVATFLSSAAGTYTATVRVYSQIAPASVQNMSVKIAEIR